MRGNGFNISVPCHNPPLTQRSDDLGRELKPVLAGVFSASSEAHYAILGLDVLLENTGALRLIEINNFPNFTHTNRINEQVNIPFFRSVLDCLTGTVTAGLKILRLPLMRGRWCGNNDGVSPIEFEKQYYQRLSSL